MPLRAEDFSYVAKTTGYMIRYKGEDVGGITCMRLGVYRPSTSKEEYAQQAEGLIRQLVAGVGHNRKDMIDVVNRINIEEERQKCQNQKNTTAEGVKPADTLGHTDVSVMDCTE